MTENDMTKKVNLDVNEMIEFFEKFEQLSKEEQKIIENEIIYQSSYPSFS